MKETKKAVTLVQLLELIIYIWKERPTCRINIDVGRNVRVTILEDDNSIIGDRL